MDNRLGFQSSYELLLESDRTSKPVGKMSLRGRRERIASSHQSGGGHGDYGTRLKDGWTRMKVHIADGVSTGDNFVHPLGEIREVLESIILGSDSAKSLSPTFLNELKDLYSFITENLISYMANIHNSKKRMGELLLDVLCYVSAVDYDDLATFPEVFASCLLYCLPSPEWDKAADDIMNRLCRYVLPRCLADSHDKPYSCMSASSSLMMVLGSCEDKKHHLLITDTLMQLKRDVCTDILSLIAFGTPTIRENALNILLHYWPIPIPEFSQDSHSIYAEWAAPTCENAGCHKGNSRVVMVCLDRQCATQHKATPIKLYMLLCYDCDRRLHESLPESNHLRMPLPRPLREVKPNCECQQACTSRGGQPNSAEVTCYHSSCSLQNGLPVRMCRDCHNKKHRDVTMDSRHFFQVGPPDPWASDDIGSCSLMLEAISKLIEVVPKLVPKEGNHPRHTGTMPRPSVPHHVSFAARSQIDIGVSREGMWLLSNYCTPTTKVRASQQEWLTHLVALVLEWLQSYYTILQQGRDEELSSASAGNSSFDTPDVEPSYVDYSTIFSNYNDISDNLISPHTLRWFCAVCDSNLECVVEALRPELPSCAQVGKLWNKAYDSNLRYKRTLSILHQLYLLCQGGKLPEESVTKLFPLVIPDWLDLLYKLRSEPGKMDKLQEQFKGIFSYKTHEEGLKKFSFIWERFRDNDSDRMQTALYWLQDLTRLEVAVPYLPHMCEDALKEKRGKARLRSHVRQQGSDSSTSFDIEAKSKLAEMNENDSLDRPRDSVASLSGYESESALVSQSSMEQGETQVVISLNSSLTRYILILDIWFTQLTELNMLTDQYSNLQKTLLQMLQVEWGSNHSFPDHLESSNLCLLCHGMSLWLTLANKLIQEYIQIESKRQRPDDEETQEFHNISTRASRFSIKTVMKSSTPKKRLASTVEHLSSSSSRPLSARIKKHSEESFDYGATSSHHLNLGRRHSDEQEFYDSSSFSVDYMRQRRPHNRSPKLRPRKIAQVRRYSDFEVIDAESPVERVTSPNQRQRPEVGSTPTLYTIFEKILQKLISAKLHPETVLHIVGLLSAMIHSCHVLDWADSKDLALQDIRELFDKLWDCLAIENSSVARVCVGLLIQSVHYLVHNSPSNLPRPHHAHSSSTPVASCDPNEGGAGGVSGESGGGAVEDMLLWKTIQKGLTDQHWTNKFKTVERFTVLLQFMCSKEVDIPFSEFEDGVKAAIAYGFCLLTQLIQDKNSTICSRAKFCISNITDTSLKAIREFLKVFFLDYIKYRDLVLHSLSLIDASLPELHLMSIDLLTIFLRNIGSSSEGDHASSAAAPGQTGGGGAAAHVQFTADSVQLGHPTLGKKVSTTSLSSAVGITPKVSVTSTTAATPFFGSLNPDDPGTNALMQKLLSLLLRHIGNRRANVTETMMKEQTSKVQQKRLSTLPHRTQPRFYVTASDVMNSLVTTIKHIFYDLKCYPQDLRQSPIFAVFLNHMFTALDRNIDFGRTKDLLQFVMKMLALSAAPNHQDFTLISGSTSKSGATGTCTYNLGHLPPSLRAPWLRVFFVILYKYIHEFSETDPSDHALLGLSSWCLEITLNTIKAEPHQCTCLTASDVKSYRPALKRQELVESLSATIEIPTVNVIEDSFSAKLQIQSARETASLSPVPEAMEGDDDEVREKRRGEDISSATKTSSQPRATTGVSSSQRAFRPSNTSTSTLGSQQSVSSDATRKAAAPGMCASCGRPMDEYTEEVIALCLVAVGTCCHRLPRTVSSYLISSVIPAIAKVVVPNSYPWQSYVDKLDQPPPGSAMSVAQHILASVLTQFADRRLFLYLFGHDHGKMSKTIFTAIVNSLATMDGEVPTDQGSGEKYQEDKLYKTSPIKYFLEDAQSLNFQHAVKRHSLINLAMYVEILQESSSLAQNCPAFLARDIVLWDNFLKKLRTHTEVARDTKAMQALMQIFVLFLQNNVDNASQHSFDNYHAHKIQSFMQSLQSVLESALHHVYCPLGGLVMLAALWNKAFQQFSQRESERFVKLYIAELKKALRVRSGTGEHVRADNFLGLIQVLLLEEDGYLGYVDGLTQRRLYAPDLKRDYETHALYLRVIDDMKWDLSEALVFLSTHNLSWPSEMIPQLKLSLAQLVALRVQHSRTPLDQLKRLVSGDIRATTNANVRQTSGTTIQLRWHDNISTLHMFTWLMLGAMCHNAIDMVAVEMKIDGSVSGQCKLLGSLSTHHEKVTEGIIRLLLGALADVSLDSESAAFGQLNLIIMFTLIWTVYMELYVPEYAYDVVKLWQKFITHLIKLLLDRQLEDNFRKEMVHSLNDSVVVKMKQMGLCCFSLLMPIWCEVSKGLSLESSIFPDFSFALFPLSIDKWFKDAVQELILIESEWQPVDTQQ